MTVLLLSRTMCVEALALEHVEDGCCFSSADLSEIGKALPPDKP